MVDVSVDVRHEVVRLFHPRRPRRFPIVFVPQPRRRPWRPVLLGAGLVAAAGWYATTSLTAGPAIDPISSAVPPGAGGGGGTNALATFDLPSPVLADNVDVSEWVARLSGPRRTQFEADLSRGTSYSWLISSELARQGLPRELAAIPLIESQYFPRARSVASAVGLWQFMEDTGRAYGLRIDDWVDERRDPVRATRAATEYLVVLKQQFGSWPLVLAAYNGGPTRLMRVMTRMGANSSTPYQALLPVLPRETQDYVPKAMAAAVISEQPSAFGLSTSPARPYRYDEVWVPGATSLESVAASLGVEGTLLTWLNPHLLRGVTPPDSWYAVRVPVGNGSTVVAEFGSSGSPGTTVRRTDD